MSSPYTSNDAAFRGAHNFDQPIGDWDTSSVTTTGETFFGASSFNQPLVWRVGSPGVEFTMQSMFEWVDGEDRTHLATPERACVMPRGAPHRPPAPPAGTQGMTSMQPSSRWHASIIISSIGIG